MAFINVEHATKVYNENTVLDDISVSFDEKKIHGITGRNGSGKTVLLKAICGFTPLTSGSISVNNLTIGKDIDVPKDVGIIIESPGFLSNYSAYGNLKLLAKITNKISNTRIKEVITIVGLNPEDKKHVGKFSMGMKQRLGIAQAIMENPTLLVLDEPFNGLDSSGIEEMHGIFLDLKKQGKTIVLASHYQEDINILCDTVHRMENGRLIQGT